MRERAAGKQAGRSILSVLRVGVRWREGYLSGLTPQSWSPSSLVREPGLRRSRVIEEEVPDLFEANMEALLGVRSLRPSTAPGSHCERWAVAVSSTCAPTGSAGWSSAHEASEPQQALPRARRPRWRSQMPDRLWHHPRSPRTVRGRPRAPSASAARVPRGGIPHRRDHRAEQHRAAARPLRRGPAPSPPRRGAEPQARLPRRRGRVVQRPCGGRPVHGRPRQGRGRARTGADRERARTAGGITTDQTS